MPLHALLPEGHRLAQDATVSLIDLAAEPIILLGLPQSRDYFLSIFYNLRLEPRIAHETPSFEMVRPNRLGLARLGRVRPTRMGAAFAGFCAERLGANGPNPAGNAAHMVAT